MQLCEVVNKATGKTRYYADGVRVSSDKFEFFEMLYPRWDCLHTTSDKKCTRHFKNVSHWSN